MTWRQTMVCAVVLGIVAAGVVWGLERFEIQRLHESFRGYLERQDQFRQWQAEHGGAET